MTGWGNGAQGIAAQRDPKSPEAPSDVALLANRCHDNQQAGVAFGSSQGCAESNDCWGNGTSGIAAARDPISPDAPSDVALLANRCHDNQQAGVLFTSSQGRAEGNDCWGNGDSGIIAQRDPKSPDAPSEVALLGNRCDHNIGAGIRFQSSTGHCIGNRCWANQGGDRPAEERAFKDPDHPTLGLLPESEVRVTDHATTPPPEDPAIERLAARSDGPLIQALMAAEAPDSVWLADYLGSGCRSCFVRFWLGETVDSITRPASLESRAEPMTATADTPRLYQLKLGETPSPSLASTAPDRSSTRAIQTATEDQTSHASVAGVFDRFVEEWLDGSGDLWSRTKDMDRAKASAGSDPAGLAWSLAVVCVDTHSLEAALTSLAEDAEARLDPIVMGWSDEHQDPSARLPSLSPPLVVDLTGMAATREPLRDLFEGQFLKSATESRGRAGGWGRWTRRAAEQVRELLVMPFEIPLQALGLTLLAIGLGWLLTWDLAGYPALTGLVARDGVHLEALIAAASEQWHTVAWSQRGVWLATVVAAVLFWTGILNLMLPARLHVRVPLAHFLFDVVRLATLGAFAEVPPKLAKTGLGRWFGKVSTRLDEAAAVRWAEHHLFGVPWRSVDLGLVVLKGVDTLSDTDLQWLNVLARRRHRGQGLLVVIHMRDLAHVAGSWLPLMTAENAPWQTCKLLHVPGLATIVPEVAHASDTGHPARHDWTIGLSQHSMSGDPITLSVPGIPAIGSQTPLDADTPASAAEGGTGGDLDAREQLSILLGCNRDAHEQERCAGSLADADWTALDLLPMLVLGSPPMAPMILIKKEVDSWKLYGPAWQREIRPFVTLFHGPDDQVDPDRETSEKLVDYSERGRALTTQLIKGDPPRWQQLIGFAGERVALAAALRNWMGAGPATEAYLARLVGGGERYHLLRCLEAITGQPWGEIPGAETHEPSPSLKERNSARSARPVATGAELPLHLEAALYLRRERLALTDAADTVLAETLTAPLEQTWDALGEALEKPLPDGLWKDAQARRADASRVLVAYLAARSLGRVEPQPAEDPDRSALAQALEVFSPPPPWVDRILAGDSPSLRQLFHEEIRRMANRLVLLKPADAREILDQRLRQDWSRLPDDVKTLIRTACLEAGRRLVRSFLEAPDASAVLGVAESFAQRPALVVATLCQLACWHQSDRGRTRAADLLPIGQFAVRLRRHYAEWDRADPAPLPSLNRPAGMTPDDTHLVAELIADTGFADRLIAVLEPGLERRRRSRKTIQAMGSIQLEGLAIGVSLPANQALNQLDPVTLISLRAED
ncbi:hypothetical protein ThidrDRAFT_2913 [Thiorhodococcus drewsii AZ1]|uniref:Right handed beta helix domain-containing protein n=1 Tax=Thiorhodococcus drewsii AZ1 TaxID=765913 RepID=G2E3Q0_9GAMM|nr:right-handed parallel beta-helix repeat-containing protein [Thiorhodococcus drewsii]EGV30163.1 hypothetical protein ThidrDRAFT_2913 [Thiorhodococcus drewsii AZ1]